MDSPIKTSSNSQEPSHAPIQVSPGPASVVVTIPEVAVSPQQQHPPQAPPDITAASNQPQQHHQDLPARSSTPPGYYTNVIPRNIDSTSVPPFLPPHLLQVILNNPDKTNATILPQPNHVMLNHLYALSIKDGIMVLSATHRFRKKYVTTLLYKPI